MSDIISSSFKTRNKSEKRKDRCCFLDFLTCERNEREKCDFELVGVKGSILEDKVIVKL